MHHQVREDCCSTRGALCVTIDLVTTLLVLSAEKWDTNKQHTGLEVIFMREITRIDLVSQWLMCGVITKIGNLVVTQLIPSTVITFPGVG